MSLKFEKVDSLVYDGLSPPDDFIRIFKLQSVFQEWDAAAQLTHFPLFLKGRASTVFEGLTTKTTIAEVFDGMRQQCGPKTDYYMNLFYLRWTQNRPLDPT